jgi:DNA-binding IscR family transcriptional regulator
MTAHGDCPQTSRCTLRRPARKIQAAISDLLDRMTLAEIMDEEAGLLAVTVNGGADEMSEEAGERR